jgi:hypothetical protein
MLEFETPALPFQVIILASFLVGKKRGQDGRRKMDFSKYVEALLQ